MGEEGGGFNIGGGYVEITLALDGARQQLEAFKGELQNSFQGAVAIPIGAGGGSAATSGVVPSPAGGASVVGFGGLPGPGPGMAPSAFGNIMPGGGASGGGAGLGDTWAAEQGVGKLKDKVDSLTTSIQAAASAAGTLQEVLGDGGSFGTSRIAGTGGMGGLRGAMGPTGGAVPYHAVANLGDYPSVPSMGLGTPVGGMIDTGPRPFHGSVDPAQMYNPVGVMGLGTPVGGRLNTGPRPFHGRVDPGEMYDPVGVMGLSSPTEDFVRPGSVSVTAGMSDAQLAAFANVIGGGGDGAEEGESAIGGRRGGRGGGFGPFGAISRATGIPYAGVVAAAYGVHVAEGFVHAREASSYIGMHPELTQNQLAQTGSGLGLMDNSAIRGISSEYDLLSQQLATRGAVNAFPGMSLFDVGGDSSFAMTQRQMRLGEQAAGIGNTAMVGRRASAMNAALLGDSEAAYRQSMSQEIAGAQERVTADQRNASNARDDLAPQARVSRLFSAGFYSAATNYAEDASENASARAAYQQLAKEASDAAVALASLKNVTEATAVRIGVQQGNAIALTMAGAQASNLQASGGSALAVMAIGQEAAMGAAANTFMATPLWDSNYNPNFTGIAQSIADMAALAASQNLDVVTQKRMNAAMGWQGESLVSAARGQTYAARSQALQAEAAAMGYDTLDVNDPRRVLMDKKFDALSVEAARSADLGELSSYGGAAVAAVQAGGDPYATSRMRLRTGFVDAAARLDQADINYPRNLANLERSYSAQAGLITADENFTVAMGDENYATRQAAAHARASYQPLTAQAEIAVQRGRDEVAQTRNPTERAKAMVTVATELDTQAKLLTSQRGGETAIDVRGSEALGMMAAYGVDLSGHGRDVHDAAAEFRKGAAGLGTSPQRPQITPGELRELFTPLFIWLSTNAPAAVTFLQGK